MSGRRTFIGGATACAATLWTARPAHAAQFEFKAGSTLPVDHPSSVRATQMWAQVERESGGRLRTAFFPNSQLGGDSAMFSQLRSNAINFMIISPGTFGSVVQGAEITNVGFAFQNSAQGFRATDGPLGQVYSYADRRRRPLRDARRLGQRYASDDGEFACDPYRR